MLRIWNGLKRLDKWLLAQKFGSGAGWALFGVVGIVASVLTFSGYFEFTFVLALIYLALGVRYIRPNL
jgi:hypothetical protein